MTHVGVAVIELASLVVVGGLMDTISGEPIACSAHDRHRPPRSEI